MTLGEFLEWIAAAVFVIGAGLWSGAALALGVAGVCLVYLAQCHADDPADRRSLLKLIQGERNQQQ